MKTWMIRQADLHVAISAAIWGIRIVERSRDGTAMTGAAHVKSITQLTLRLSPGIRQLEMGDDVACALGVNTNRTRLALMDESLLSISDWIVKHALGQQLPAGVMTVRRRPLFHINFETQGPEMTDIGKESHPHRRATLRYDDRTTTENLSIAIPDRSFTAIVGANGCGKSTL